MAPFSHTSSSETAEATEITPIGMRAIGKRRTKKERRKKERELGRKGGREVK